MDRHDVRRIERTTLAMIAVVATGLMAAGRAPAADSRLNVVLIVADDLGWGEVGAYGQRRIPTPHIDSLALDGMRFTRFYAGAPVCAPSRCVLMTGRHTGHAEIRGNRQAAKAFPEFTEGQHPLSAEAVTFPSLLRAAGYATGAMGKWGLGPVGSSGDPQRQGFDLFFGYNCQAVAHSYYPPTLWRNAERIPLNERPIPGHAKQPEGEVAAADYIGTAYAPHAMVAEAEAFVADHAAGPFFLYLPFIEPHLALHPPQAMVDRFPREWDERPYRGENGYLPHPRPRAAYAASIAELDDHVGRVLAALDRAGVADRTLVLFTSDNGTTHGGGKGPFHVGGADPPFFESTAGLRGAKGSVYEGGLRVPFIARLPGVIPAGVVADTVVWSADLFPTICAACGVEPPVELDGTSLWDLLRGRADALPQRKPPLWVFPEYGGQVAVLLGDMKALRRKLNSPTPDPWEVYDLAADPAESDDLAATRSDVIAEAEAVLAREVADNPVFPVPIPPSAAAAAPGPVRVFVLAGQSNMEGQAVVDLDGRDYNEGRGTLVDVLRRQAGDTPFRHLRAADGGWAVRDDVWVSYRRERAEPLVGPLSIGFTVYGDAHHFGPELQFGHVVGEAIDAPVLLVKTAWGGKSLAVDFRPPSAGGTVGPYYEAMIAAIHDALAAPPDMPGRDRGCELAGFVWYHGWNDGVDPQRAVPEYEENLAALIRDVRREFAAPRLPVVVGELTGPWVEAPGEWQTLRAAQRACAERAEFAGTVAFVETHDFVRPAEDSPNPGHGHHEFGNAETSLLVGDALARGMLGLLATAQAAAESPVAAASDQPASRTEIDLRGWTVRVDDRLLPGGSEAELGGLAIEFLSGKLADIQAVVPRDKLPLLERVTIVMDVECGDLGSMQYHPSAEWLEDHGYPRSLEKCVHIPRAADLPVARCINEQPWVILHELAHAYHDQVLGFDDPRVIDAYEAYKGGGRGDATLLYDGSRVRHYALTDHKEFFAEMTEAFFGSNDFFPFNRAELGDAEPAIMELMRSVWLGQ